MLSVTDEQREAFLNGSTKSITIYFPALDLTLDESTVIAESVEISQALEESNALSFKGCIATKLKFKAEDVEQDLRGYAVEVSIQAGTETAIQIFTGYIAEQSNETHEDILTEFVGYDILGSIASLDMQDWIDSLTFPQTVSEFRYALLDELGLTCSTETLVNDSLSISANITSWFNHPTARELLQWVCEVNGVFGRISAATGNFEFVHLKEITEYSGLYPSSFTFPGSTTYPSSGSYQNELDSSEYISIDYQPYETEEIDDVWIYDGGGVLEGYTDSTATNPFCIVNNPIASNVTMSTAADNLADYIGGLPYTPVKALNVVGMPWLECGDCVRVETEKNTVKSYILRRTLTGIQALFDSYESDSDREQPERTANTTTRQNSDKKTVLEIQADIVEINELVATKATITELEAAEARIDAIEADYITTTELEAVTARIDTIESDYITTSELDAAEARITTIESNYVTTDYLTANYMTASNITSNYATFGWVQSNYVTATTVEATYATITSLNAVNANFSSLNASNITSGTLSVDRLDVATLAGTTFSGYTLTCGTINNTGSYIIVSNSTYQAKAIYAYADSSTSTRTLYTVLAKS